MNVLNQPMEETEIHLCQKKCEGCAVDLILRSGQRAHHLREDIFDAATGVKTTIQRYTRSTTRRVASFEELQIDAIHCRMIPDFPTFNNVLVQLSHVADHLEQECKIANATCH